MSDSGFYALALDIHFIQQFAPASLKKASEEIVEKAQSLTKGIDMPSDKWLTKNMSEGLKQCRCWGVCLGIVCGVCGMDLSSMVMDSFLIHGSSFSNGKRMLYELTQVGDLKRNRDR